MNKISSQELKDWIANQPIAVLFFKSKRCGVCHSQLPHIQAIAEELEVGLKVIDLSENRHLSAEQMVLNVPLTKVFFGGKEMFKEGAYLNFNRLRRLLAQLNMELQGE